MINVVDFKKPMGLLLAETFGVLDESSATFLDSGRAGLLGTIDMIDAKVASTAPALEHETIASHCGHVLFILHLFDANDQGQTPEADWAESWKTGVVDDAAWKKLRAELRNAYETVAGRLQAREQWPETAVAAWATLLAHCTYHTGVIHKLRTWVEAAR